MMDNVEIAITVAELIERLKQVNQEALVIADCFDDTYAGPVTSNDIITGTINLSAPFKRALYEWETEDANYGRRECPGGWFFDYLPGEAQEEHGEILQQRP